MLRVSWQLHIKPRLGEKSARLSGGAAWMIRVCDGVVSLYRGTVKLSMPGLRMRRRCHMRQQWNASRLVRRLVVALTLGVVLPLAAAPGLHAPPGDTCLEMTGLLDHREDALVTAFPAIREAAAFKAYRAAKHAALADIQARNTRGREVDGATGKTWPAGDTLYHAALTVRLRLVDMLKEHGPPPAFADALAGDMALAALHVAIHCMTYF